MQDTGPGKPKQSFNAAIHSGYVSRLRSFSPNARQFLLFVFLTTLNVGVYGVIFNLYILSLGFREDFLGLILSLSSASIGLFAIPSAFVCDRLGNRKTLLLSSVLMTLSLAFLYNTTSVELLIISSVLYGIAQSLSLVTGGTLLVDSSAAYERMHLFSAYYVIYTASMLLGNIAGGFLPGPLADMFLLNPGGDLPYRLTLYLSLAATVLSLVPLAYIAEDSQSEIAGRGRPSVYKAALKSKAVAQTMFIFCLLGLGWGISYPYFNVYFNSVLGASTGQIGAIFSISQLSMVAGYFLVPILTPRLGKIRFASAMQLLSIPFLLIFALSSSILIAAFGYTMRYMLMNMANPILNSFKLEIVGSDQRSIVNSMTWMAFYTFVGIGAYAGGLIMAGGQNSVPFLITSAVYALTAFLYYMCFKDVEYKLNE